jgi:hypothetical protein
MFTEFVPNSSASANSTERRKRSKRTQRRIFSSVEDALLTNLVSQMGENAWPFIASCIPDRTVRQCKERYFTYLCPSVRTESWTECEDDLLLQKVREIGPHWTLISRYFEGRTPNALKNRWHFHFRENQQKKVAEHHRIESAEICGKNLLPPISNFPFVENGRKLFEGN